VTGVAPFVAVLGVVVGAAAPAMAVHPFEAGNDVYRVSITRVLHDTRSPQTGFHAAMTGPRHPLTASFGLPVEVTRTRFECPGCTGDSDTNFWVVRSYASRWDYTLGSNPVSGYFSEPEPGWSCVSANDLAPIDVEPIVDAGREVGLTARWRIVHAGDDLTLEERLLVHGEDYVGSSVEVCLRLVNHAPVTAVLGLRAVWRLAITAPVTPWNPTGTGTTGHFYTGMRPPDPPLEPFLDVEVEWEPPVFRMWQVHAGSAYPSVMQVRYSVAGAVTGPASLDPPPTPPDLLQVAEHDHRLEPLTGGGARLHCFDWRVPNPPRPWSTLNSMGIVAYWGPDEERAIVLPPGAEVTVTQYLVAFDVYPLSVETSGPFERHCEGAVTTVPVSGQAITTHPTVATFHRRWSSPDARVTFADPTAPTTDAIVQGVGEFPVTLTVSVGAYEASAETTVVVRDPSPPEWLALTVTPEVLWPPSHRLHDVHVDTAVVDDCDPAPVVRLVSVTSDEAPDELGSGNTEPDILGAELGTADFDVRLRAERSGRNAGRTYTLGYEAVDWAGNVSTRSVAVRVPHDLRRSEPLRGPARDGTPRR
jgi:hypothetical protein